MTTGTVLNPVDCMISVHIGHNLMTGSILIFVLHVGEIKSQTVNNLPSMKIIYILLK